MLNLVIEWSNTLNSATKLQYIDPEYLSMSLIIIILNTFLTYVFTHSVS